MAQLPQEQKAKIAEQVASFQEEKSKLDAEVSKWDDSGNDIIVLAKQMCMIMMEMTDFTRWDGTIINELKTSQRILKYDIADCLGDFCLSISHLLVCNMF